MPLSSGSYNGYKWLFYVVLFKVKAKMCNSKHGQDKTLDEVNPYCSVTYSSSHQMSISQVSKGSYIFRSHARYYYIERK